MTHPNEYDGLYGLNARINGGINRDNTIAVLRDLKGAFDLIQDDPQFAAQAASLGIKVIYRASGDDPQSNPLAQSPAAFVQARADAAPTAAYLHLTNELDPTPELHKWTLEAMQYANRIGRKVCIYNYSTNKDRAQYEASRANIVFAKRYGHAVGIHIYEDGIHDGGAYDGWLPLKREVGGLWIVTEYAPIQSIFDANTGYRAFMTLEQVIAFMGKRIAFFEREGMPLMWFSYDDWPNNQYGREKGFGIWRDRALVERLIALNRSFKYREAISVINYPKPESMGEPHDAVVSWVKNVYVNLRADPSAKAADIGDVHLGDKIRIRPDTWANEGYKWARLESPAGWIAVDLVQLSHPESIDEPRKRVDVPFVSQIGIGANTRQNDCGVACALMVLQWRLIKAGLKAARLLTVDKLVSDTPLVSKDTPQPITTITNLLDGYGVTAKHQRPLTTDAIRAEIDAGRPVIVLVNYEPIGGERFGHYVVVYAYGARGFWVHDPYKKGAEVYVTRDALDRALTDVSAFAAFPYQGVVLSV